MTDARDIARQLIESSATDIEFGDIGDYIAGLDGAAADTDAEFDQLQRQVDDLIGKATVTATWDDEASDPAAEVERLKARIAAAVEAIDRHDGPEAPYADHWKWAEVRAELCAEAEQVTP